MSQSSILRCNTWLSTNVFQLCLLCRFFGAFKILLLLLFCCFSIAGSEKFLQMLQIKNQWATISHNITMTNRWSDIEEHWPSCFNAMLCWETLGYGIHVNALQTSYTTLWEWLSTNPLTQWCQTDPVKSHVAAGFHSNQARTHLI